MDRDQLVKDLMRDEGVHLTVYDDATGKPLKKGDTVVGHPTIGIGRALDFVHGITKEEALFLAENDIEAVERQLVSLPYWAGLDEVRQRVLANMAFNLGFAGLLGFRDMLRDVSEARWEFAARAMEDSIWYRAVGDRGVRLAETMRTGKDPQ